MYFLSKHKAISAIIGITAALLVVGLSNFLYLKFTGSDVPIPDIPRGEVVVGAGPELKYLILGDSTSVSQGSNYEDGYVVGSATALGADYEVTYQNFGVSGAVVKDVLVDQLPRSEVFVPDVTLVAIGANDVTHLIGLQSIENDMRQIIDTLRERNPKMKIVLTGSASLGDVKRLGYPARWLAGFRTRQINEVILKVANEKNATFAYVARDTGPQFRDNQDTFFSADNFHPNAAGYAVWTPVVTNALKDAISAAAQ
jgi:lysophospholipase L1-like esterase